MSQVVSFRLDESNPREAQALQVLQAWVSRGNSIRFTVVEALLALENYEKVPENLASTLQEIYTLLQELRTQPQERIASEPSNTRLSGSFMEAIVKSTRPGLRAE